LVGFTRLNGGSEQGSDPNSKILFDDLLSGSNFRFNNSGGSTDPYDYPAANPAWNQYLSYVLKECGKFSSDSAKEGTCIIKAIMGDQSKIINPGSPLQTPFPLKFAMPPKSTT